MADVITDVLMKMEGNVLWWFNIAAFFFFPMHHIIISLS